MKDNDEIATALDSQKKKKLKMELPIFTPL